MSRQAIVWSIVCLAGGVLAGCTETPETPLPEAPVEVAPPPAPLPPSLFVNATMPPSTTDTPQLPLDGPPCSGRVEVCHVYAFNLSRDATLTVFLEWPPGTNDLDLYLFQDGTVVYDEAATANSRGEFMRVALETGDYEVRIAGYFSTTTYGGTAGTPYSLQAHFDEPRAPNP